VALGASEAEAHQHGAWTGHLLPGQSGLMRHGETPRLHTLAALDQPATTDVALAALRRWIEAQD
jgi:hypothetical protein